MTVKMTRAEKSKITQQKIKEAAIKLIREKGYEATTVNDICKEANVAIGSFYHFFSGKDALTIGFFESALQSFKEKYPVISNDPKEAIVQIACGYAECLADEGVEVVSSIYNNKNKTLSLIAILATSNTDRPFNLMIENQIRKGIENGIFNKGINAQLTAIDLATCMIGINMRWICSDGKFDIVDMHRRIVSNYVDGLCKL